MYIIKINLGRKIISSFLIIILVLVSFSILSKGAPSLIISAEIEGFIKDMWLTDGRCCFKIEITQSNRSWPDKKIVEVQVQYLDDATGNYEDMRSSQGWKIGDIINGTLFYQCDEDSEWYWFETYSKSDDNYAKPLTSEKEIPILLYLFTSISVIIIFLIFIYLLQRIKKKKRSIDRKR